MQRKCVFAHMSRSAAPPLAAAATAPLDAAKHASAILKHISLECITFASPSKNVLTGRARSEGKCEKSAKKVNGNGVTAKWQMVNENEISTATNHSN